MQVINPRIRQICDAAFPGSNPASPLCVRGSNSRLLDQAFLNAGFPVRDSRNLSLTIAPYTNDARLFGVVRLEQINMIGTTNRSLFDSWTTTLRRRTRKITISASYVLASSGPGVDRQLLLTVAMLAQPLLTISSGPSSLVQPELMSVTA